MFDTARIAERQIQEAIEAGAFDDLPGKGKPFEPDDDPSCPLEYRMVNRILKNAGVLPDWIELDREIDAQREACGRLLRQVEADYPRRRVKADSPTVPSESERARRAFSDWLGRRRAEYVAAMRRVNSDILKLNMRAPARKKVQIPYNVSEQVEAFDRRFPSLPGSEVAPPDSPREEGGLRAAAAALYRNRVRGSSLR